MVLHLDFQSMISALGNALLNSFWQMGLLWLLVFLIIKLFPKLTPTVVNQISFLALVTGFIAFATSFWLSINNATLSLSLLEQIDETYLKIITKYSAIVYLILLLFPLYKLFLGFSSTYILKNTGISRVPGHYKLFVADMANNLGISRKINIFASSVAQSPLTTGFIKPIILLPAALLNQLTTREIEAIILHELAHIKRNDFLQNIIIQFILTFLYFNPFAKLLAKMAQKECEKSADQWVTRFEYNDCMYAGLLLQLAKQNIIDQNRLAIQITGKQTPLLERVEWIFGKGKRQIMPVKNLAFLLIIITVSILFSGGQKTRPNISNFYSNNYAIYQPVVSFVEIPNETHKEEQVDNKSVENLKITKSQPSKVKKEVKQTFTESDINPIINEPLPAAIFVHNATEVIPALTPAEEEDIRLALEATQKILIAANWEMIEKALAETMTTSDKLVLKEAYIKKMESADWSKQANQLRLKYADIDWNMVNNTLLQYINHLLYDSLPVHSDKMMADSTVLKKQASSDTITLL